MSSTTLNEFLPDYVSYPGETLLESLEERGMSQTELAERTGRPKKTINEIVKGKAAITPETALQLERVLGIPARFWNNRERQHQEALARAQEQVRLQSQLSWLQEFPVKEMVQKGWIAEANNQIEQLEVLLNFFGISSFENWKSFWETKVSIAFRKPDKHSSHPGALTAWLQKGEIESQAISCRVYDKDNFKDTLGKIRNLTAEPLETALPKVVDMCAAAGVAVVFVPQLSKTRASGAAHWIKKDKAIIQLSIRYKTDDHLWFSFFHEAGHILLHQKRLMFIEFNSGKEDSKIELEADRFAADTLIPPSQLEVFLLKRKGKISKSSIQAFSSELGIAPGIVVGRLQHEKLLPMSHCNQLKRRLKWAG